MPIAIPSDPGLQVVGRGVKCLANLRHEARGEVTQRPVVVHLRPQAQLPRHYARRNRWNQFVELKINIILMILFVASYKVVV